MQHQMVQTHDEGSPDLSTDKAQWTNFSRGSSALYAGLAMKSLEGDPHNCSRRNGDCALARSMCVRSWQSKGHQSVKRSHELFFCFSTLILLSFSKLKIKRTATFYKVYQAANKRIEGKKLKTSSTYTIFIGEYNVHTVEYMNPATTLFINTNQNNWLEHFIDEKIKEKVEH